MADGIESLAFHRFPTCEYPLAAFGIRVDEIAIRLGFRTLDYDEDDGLGPAHGLVLRASSGLVFVLVEHEISIRQGYARGPLVYVDASDLAARGAETLMAEVVEALGLTQSEVVRVVGRDEVRDAARLVEQCRDTRD